MLSNLITKDRICIIDCLDSWQEAVLLTAKPLLEDGSIEASYVESVINNIEKNGPYIILMEDFALPHAQNLNNNVKRTGMSLLVVKEGVSFSNSKKDIVRVIILLASLDASVHMQTMVQLVGKLETPGWVKKLIQAKSIEEIQILLL